MLKKKKLKTLTLIYLLLVKKKKKKTLETRIQIQQPLYLGSPLRKKKKEKKEASPILEVDRRDSDCAIFVKQNSSFDSWFISSCPEHGSRRDKIKKNIIYSSP